MERYTRAGRRFPLPSTVEIKHELRVRMQADRVADEKRRLAAAPLAPAPKG